MTFSSTTTRVDTYRVSKRKWRNFKRKSLIIVVSLCSHVGVRYCVLVVFSLHLLKSLIRFQIKHFRHWQAKKTVIFWIILRDWDYKYFQFFIDNRLARWDCYNWMKTNTKMRQATWNEVNDIMNLFLRFWSVDDDQTALNSIMKKKFIKMKN